MHSNGIYKSDFHVMWIHLQQARLLPTEQRIEWLSNMEIGILMSCPHILAGFCIKTHQSLQKYEKTERHMLVCTDCPQPPLVRASRSQEHCARKCRKVKKNFTCRWVAFFCLFCVSLKSRRWFLHGLVPLIPPLLLCGHSIYIFLLFIICSSLNYFPCVPTGLSTFNGTTGNATCFPLTASPRVCRGRPTSTLLCMKKKVNDVIFTLLKLTLCTLLFFSWERSGAERDCVGSLVFRLFGFSVDIIKAANPPNHPPPPPCCLITPVRRVACINMLADLSGV